MPGPVKDALRDARVIVGVTGGIAAYKTATLVSRLAQSGAKVTVHGCPEWRPIPRNVARPSIVRWVLMASSAVRDRPRSPRVPRFGAP